MANLKSAILATIAEAELTPDERLRWQAAGAEAMAARGNTRQAVEAYQQFALQHPDDGDVQETFARMLSANDDIAEQSLQQWRKVLAGSRPGSARYYRAKLGLAKAHVRMKAPEKAAKMIRLMKAIDPAMGGVEMKTEFEQLLSQIETE